ncbi:Monooxygenase PC-14-like protein [Cladobotryum mycophilum]|uniref:Monooxygenase PC-14-like protein n=1 Tax=Cladobotryum mycophilum TaxID=491253 RepID=A0ABR0S7P0_9HYPO
MSKSVCIVGAGPSGLVAAKTLLHNAPPGAFKVSVFDAQDDIGGLWPTSKTDNGRQVHPLMVANQSKHTVQFSDLAWEDGAPQFPRAWMVGKYLERYLDRYLKSHPDFELHLGTRIVKAERRDQDGWKIQIKSEAKEETRDFDYLLIASGYFGKPIIPECFQNPSTLVPIIHSTQYRDLKSLLGTEPRNGGKILVVGGQMSGVETAGTIALHLSSAVNSPQDFDVPNIDKYSIQHVIQRPVWVFPLYTSPEPSSSTPSFLPLDFSSYNLNNRLGSLTNTQGHITEEVAETVHGMFEAALGDQSDFSPLLQPGEKHRAQPPYLAVSDWYCDFVRSGTINLSMGNVAAFRDDVATLLRGGSKIDDIAAVVLATGFDPSPCVDFLPEDVLETLQHTPQYPNQALALAFHGTHHPDIPNLGFVGFYRSPYWGVMQMQARFLTELWSNDKGTPTSQSIQQKLKSDSSISRTLSLRGDPRLSQFPMGDYLYLIQEFSQALSMEIHPPLVPDTPALSRNNLPLDMLTPSRYTSPSDDPQAKQEAQTSLTSTRDVTLQALTTPRFVARAVFRSLLGPWRLERHLTSKLPSHPSGTFTGTAQFLLRQQTPDGIQCAIDGTPATPDDDDDGMALEYLYIEDGEFKTTSGFGFKATRRYIWRYHPKTDRISVWFARTDDANRADYLFHEIEFTQPDKSTGSSKGGRGWPAKAGHLCIDDYYNVKYDFAFKAVNLSKWSIEYTVNGPKKDYTIHGTYQRI